MRLSRAKEQYENAQRLTGKGLVRSPVINSSCSHCTFPRELTTGNLSHNSCLCPCDVAISVMDEPCWLGMSTHTGKHNELVGSSLIRYYPKHQAQASLLKDTRKQNSLKEKSVVENCWNHGATLYELESAMDSLRSKAMKLEAQRRIDLLNSAVSARHSMHMVSDVENVNNSSCSSRPSDAGEIAQDSVSASRSIDKQLHTASDSCKRNIYQSVASPMHMRHKLWPPVSDRCRYGFDFQQPKSCMRYHPYLRSRHWTHKHYLKAREKQKTYRGRHRRQMANKNESFPSHLGKICHRNMCNRRNTFYDRPVFLYNSCKMACGFLPTDNAVLNSCSPPPEISRDNAGQGTTVAGGNNLGRILRHNRPSDQHSECLLESQQDETAVHCELDVGKYLPLETHEFSTLWSGRRETRCQLSDNNILPYEQIEENKKSVRILENSSLAFSQNIFNNHFLRDKEQDTQSSKLQSCMKLVNHQQFLSQTNDFGHANLDNGSAQLQIPFAFSRPLVALQNNNRETEAALFIHSPISMRRNVSCPNNPCFDGLFVPYSQTSLIEGLKKRKGLFNYILENDNEKVLYNTKESEAGHSMQRSGRFEMDTLALPKGYSIENDLIDNDTDGGGKLTDLHTSSGEMDLNSSGYPKYHHKRVHSAMFQGSNRDGTYNKSNNNDTARPFNNNSTNQQHNTARPDGRVVKVEGDGRCLFRSLVTAEYLPLQASWRDEFGRPVNRDLAQLETTRADQLRSRVVTIMSDNMHFYSQLGRGIINADQPMDGNYQRFLDRLRAMSEPSTMPGDLELNAVAMVMERQILVLDTNLNIITSYGHDRFPQSVPLAVRYTRLVADVGHYDAVILGDDVSSHVTPQGRAPALESSGHSGLCGQFRRLATSSGGQNNTTHPGNAVVYCKGGDTTLNAKKEFFYLRDSDKSLHSDGLQPVTSITSKTAAPPAREQRTAEAATSTARAAVFWPAQHDGSSQSSKRRKRRTFSDKFTQTYGELEKPLRPEWKKQYYQYRYGLCKPSKPVSERKYRRGATSMGGLKRGRRKTCTRKPCHKGININWNSHIKHPKGTAPYVRKTSLSTSGVQNEVTPERFKSLRIKDGRKCNCKLSKNTKQTFKPVTKDRRLASYGSQSNKEENPKASKTMPTAAIPYVEKMGSLDARKRSGTTCKRKNPTMYINICSPNKPPKPVKPEVTRPRAATPCHSGRRRKSTVERNRIKRRRTQTLSPVFNRSPPDLSKKPRLPDAFEPAQCRCVVCNTKIEPSSRESAKCFMCGRMAHRACVMKESSRGQGGGDQNYFICSLCAPL